MNKLLIRKKNFSIGKFFIQIFASIENEQIDDVAKVVVVDFIWRSKYSYIGRKLGRGNSKEKQGRLTALAEPVQS